MFFTVFGASDLGSRLRLLMNDCTIGGVKADSLTAPMAGIMCNRILSLYAFQVKGLTFEVYSVSQVFSHADKVILEGLV